MMKGMSGVSSTTISLYVVWMGICEEELSMSSTEVPPHPPLKKVNINTNFYFYITSTAVPFS